jgi:hypothetical protein
MTRLRRLILHYRAMALAMIALALAMKALIPAGTMIGGDARALTVQICDGYADAGHALVIALKRAAPAKSATDHAGDHQTCPFSALGHAGLAGADPLLLALALAFAVLLALATPLCLAPRAPSRLRPPLRAPPVFA